MKIIYRKARICDLNPLCNLWDKLDRSHIDYNPIYKLSSDAFEKRKRFIKKKIRSKNNFTYLAEKKGEIIGFINGEIENNPPIFRIKKVGKIDTLFVKKEYRGSGVGTKLTRMLLKEFSKRRLRFIKLTVDVHNFTAIRLYKCFGFKDFQIKMIKGLRY